MCVQNRGGNGFLLFLVFWLVFPFCFIALLECRKNGKVGISLMGKVTSQGVFRVFFCCCFLLLFTETLNRSY